MKKKFRKFKRFRKAGVVKYSGLSIAPAKALMKVKYAQDLNSASVGTGTIGQINFFGNGIADCSLTTAGQLSAYNLSQMAAYYKNYIVHKSIIKVQVWTRTDIASDGSVNRIYLGPAFEDNASNTDAPTQTQSSLELNKPGFQKKYIWPWASSQNCGKAWTKFSSMKQRSKSMMPNFDALTASGNMTTAPAATNPTQVWWWQLCYCNDSGASITFYYTVKIIYYVEFFNRYPATGTQIT